LNKKEYAQKVAKCDNLCEICGRPERNKMPSGRLKKLCVDHDHLDGAIRGILCHRCNFALGAIEDSENIAQAIIRYLKKYKRK